ncbi:MAG: glycosyl transferase [Candidatus Taylorbacteria bacterium RIFCSPHIGHO2_02_49_25]|uniref:Glycosyl transferase n=1 Tax=Candidatus Taylorbacteria bacterium RIFCSPHIGHO2_02_49_25 TaxID=1802305 RepID=A0A1G2MB01_9BACT|nr:MAG: Glycosyl transferase, family 2 [Parcubacteria group bacterium GW2011_GWF2_50_9]OHA19162.1 MAG: glycosyl transferase [Candidatus Taylorbacteria bacterium RIFCSPHIGHO2_01_FULL_49_60]OHA21105.1 MAG: glycosyl transferase [Candidatus Taylorbacteria bacterium RIFCSPHIGHO2_02_49_25]OHA37308.1 MAG: glycosyl transferase [Candidatus Taylorbacteria bacterium RIFCSPLOWO2_02_50_13]OHA46543.1 MAG: glycosyl transferase [Candidatus Taylorbacteria bacterium RIFCSPLOWO2_12_FULL_49_67]HCB35629.1 glycosyl
MRTLTVIAPVYNEEEVILDFYRELKRELEKLSGYRTTILFSVGRGTDKTLEILKEVAEKDRAVRVLYLSARCGHQMQLLAGVDHADSDAVIMMDSDLQHPPSLILKLLAEFENGNDVVYTIREETQEQPTLRKLCSDIFYFFLNLISDVPISGNAADFRLISRRVADVFKKDVRERNLFLRGIVPWIGFNQAAVRFTAHPRRAGTSKYSLSRLITFGLSGVVSFSRKPLRLTILTGLLFALFGFLYALFTIIQYLFLESLPSGYATLVVLLSLFSGFQLIFLGIIGEYVGAIFDEVKRRPHYIVDEKINF